MWGEFQDEYVWWQVKLCPQLKKQSSLREQICKFLVSEGTMLALILNLKLYLVKVFLHSTECGILAFRTRHWQEKTWILAVDNEEWYWQ